MMKPARVLLFTALGIALVFAITSDAQQPSSLNKDLRTAAQEGNGKWVDTLLAEGAVTKELALLEAASYGRTNVVKFLLDHGAHIETYDGSGDSPLVLAAIKPMLEYLASCSKVSLESFELAGLNDRANLRKNT
jgi:hypothetical protein